MHAARIAMIEGRNTPLSPMGIPTRVLWGAHDPVLKTSRTDRLHEHFSNLQVSLAPDAGHFVHVECPDLAAQDIERFFRGSEGDDPETGIDLSKPTGYRCTVSAAPSTR
jgi:epoxide hydrolase 4